MLTFLLIGFAIYDLFMVYVTPMLTPSKESGIGCEAFFDFFMKTKGEEIDLKDLKLDHFYTK